MGAGASTQDLLHAARPSGPQKRPKWWRSGRNVQGASRRFKSQSLSGRRCTPFARPRGGSASLERGIGRRISAGPAVAAGLAPLPCRSGPVAGSCVSSPGRKPAAVGNRAGLGPASTGSSVLLASEAFSRLIGQQLRWRFPFPLHLGNLAAGIGGTGEAPGVVFFR